MITTHTLKLIAFIFIAFISVSAPCFAGKIATNPSNPAKLTPEEQNWIKEHPIIRVGIDPSWAPIEYFDDDNQPEGISIQYLDSLSHILGLKFEVSKRDSWTEVLNKLSQKKLDLLPAVSNSHARRFEFSFTKPYLSTPNGIFSATKMTYLSGIDALIGKKVLTVKGYAINAWLKDNYPDLNLLTSPNIEDALKKVSSGEAFAFIGNLITTNYYIGQTGLTQVRVVGEVPYKNELAMAVRKDWEILPKILNKGIAAIPQSRKKTIYNSWISIKYQHYVNYAILWKLLGISLLILLITLYWNRRLAREISHRCKIEKSSLSQSMMQKKHLSLKVNSLPI